MGVLNLTMDKAPTSPKDNAKEFLTMTITTKTIHDKVTKFLAIDDLLNETLEYLRKISFKINENKTQKAKFIIVNVIEISLSWDCNLTNKSSIILTYYILIKCQICVKVSLKVFKLSYINV